MTIIFGDRPSDSPLVERVWRSHSEGGGLFSSISANHCMMVVTRLCGTITLDVRGPETKATSAYCPADGEWLGIQFKYGTFMPRFPVPNLVDGKVTLPKAARQSFWLDGSVWQFPDYENADTFVNRLVHHGLLVHEPVVDAVSRGQPHDLSLRSVQRRVLQATGMSRRDSRLIERARYATVLLRQGTTAPEVVNKAGYFDQPHLIRSLKRFIGQTPTQIVDESNQLSFLYNTASS
jgi:AraC-like DNA-binding protein